MIEKLTVKIGEQILTEGKEFSFSRSIENLCGSFEITCKTGEFEEGEKVLVFYGSQLLMSAYLEVIQPSYSDSQSELKIAGRDISCDLVDCSYEGSSHEFKGTQSLVDIAEKLAKDFGIEVISKLRNPPKVSDFTVQPGEGVFECIERAFQSHGVLFQTSPKGELILDTPMPNKLECSLIEGINIKSGYAQSDASSRFSSYQVKGQDKSGQNLEGIAKDHTLRRYRPKVLIVNDETTKAFAQQRAAWENGIRVSRSKTVNLELYGWESSEGNLWQVGMLVNVFSRKLLLENELMMISAVSLNYGESGTISQLSLVRPDAFIPMPEIQKPKNKTSQDKALRKKFNWID